MLRICVAADGNLAVVEGGQVDGRSAYLHPKRACAQALVRRKLLRRSLGRLHDPAEQRRLLGELELRGLLHD